MRVLVQLRRNPAQHYLVHLFTKALIQEVKDLISDNQHSKAVVTVFTKGILERKVSKEEIPAVTADLILSERNARWDGEIK